jgi:DNA-binding transcriptional MerR regulator/effector-binding domain-containing protein
MREPEIYSIGKASAVTGISTKTLRYYDSLKLIVPEIRNPQNNYRYYSRNQVATLVAIQRLREMGCGIKELHAVVGENSLSGLYEQVRLRMAELEYEIAERQAIIKENKEFLDRIQQALQIQQENSVSPQNTSSTYQLNNARIEEIPKSYLFCEQRMMPNYNVMDTSVSFRVELYHKCRASGLQIVGPEVTTYYTPDLLGQFIVRDCLIQMGITVENKPGCGDIQEFGGFTAATTIHMGTYHNMVNTHMLLIHWINQQGYEVNGEVSELFLVSPLYSLKPENQIIKVIMPVKKRNSLN